MSNRMNQCMKAKYIAAVLISIYSNAYGIVQAVTIGFWLYSIEPFWYLVAQQLLLSNIIYNNFISTSMDYGRKLTSCPIFGWEHP